MEKATTAVLELIESAEMRGYLKKAGDTLPLRVWLEAAAGAPAPLEKKLTVLERIVLAQTEPGARRLAEEYCRAAARALEALTRPQTPGTVFQLVQVSAAEDSNRMERDDVFLFTEWKAAQAFARAYLDELYKDEPPEEKARSWYWYELTLCRPEEGGMLRPGPYTYLLSAAGEAWLFMRERPDGKATPQPEEDFWWSGLSLNLPVPFRPGDILTVDCRPFAGPGRCLVLEVGDNRDCCCVQVLYPCPGGRADIGALKHGHCFCSGVVQILSPLYRVSRWTGQLPPEEVFLEPLSRKLHADPLLGPRLWTAIYRYELETDRLGGQSSSGIPVADLLALVP